MAICVAGARRYNLSLGRTTQFLWKDRRDHVIGQSKANCSDGKPHTFRLSRRGATLTVWVDGSEHLRLTDPDQAGGTVSLGCADASVVFDDIRIIGRLDPQWLSAGRAAVSAPHEPGSAEAVYARGVAELRPLWRERRFGEALARASELVREEPCSSRPTAAKALVEDCQALVNLWKAVERGAATLKAGQRFRVRGMLATVEKVQNGVIQCKVGPASFARKLTELSASEALALAVKTRQLTSGPDRLAVSLLELVAPRPDLAAARATLERAADAGVDISLRRALLAQGEARTTTGTKTASPPVSPPPSPPPARGWTSSTPRPRRAGSRRRTFPPSSARGRGLRKAR